MVELPSPGEQQPGDSLTLLTDADGAVVRRSVTDSGLRVLTESSSTGRAVTIGVAVPVGSRDESDLTRGASHFLEHLLFKGTARRSALEISAAIESVGGDLNAFTGKEYTCFYARVLDRDAALAVDVLVDMVTSALLAEADVESERAVVIEEIAMHDDDPGGVAHELFSGQAFARSPLAHPITGTQKSIAEMSLSAIREHYRRWYALDNLSVVAAGRIDHDDIVAAVEQSLARASELRRSVPVPRRTHGDPDATLLPGPATLAWVRPTEQVNLVLGTHGVSRLDDRRYAASVFNAAIGAGMSSRLFQKVREERGLAYAVQSSNSMYSDAGVFGAYAGTSLERAEETLDVMGEVLDEVGRFGFTDEEIERGKGQLRGGLVLGSEESSSRMVALAEAELITGKVPQLSQALAKIDAVTGEEIAAVTELIVNGPRIVASVGPAASGG